MKSFVVAVVAIILSGALLCPALYAEEHPELSDTNLGIDNPAEQLSTWFPDENEEWLLNPPESIVLLVSEEAAVMATSWASPIIGDILKIGPRPPFWVDTPECLAWESAVEALGPRPFKNYERESLFEWNRKYEELGSKPEMKDNNEARNMWDLEFLKIMQKYKILNDPIAYTGRDFLQDWETVDRLLPLFAEVLRLRLYEELGYSVEGVNVFKVQTMYGWYPEVYYLLKRTEL